MGLNLQSERRDELHSLHLFTFCLSFHCVCVCDFDWFCRVRVCLLYVGLISYYFTRYFILFNSSEGVDILTFMARS